MHLYQEGRILVNNNLIRGRTGRRVSRQHYLRCLLLLLSHPLGVARCSASVAQLKNGSGEIEGHTFISWYADRWRGCNY